MPRRLAVFLLPPLVVLVGGCGTGDPPAPDPSCTASAGAIERSLQRAPRPVTLSGGTLLSECVERSRNDAQLQELGRVLTQVSDDLAVRAQAGDTAAATALGYLVGATRRGAEKTSGIHAELARRMERSAAFLEEGGRRVAVALERGLEAGRQTG